MAGVPGRGGKSGHRHKQRNGHEDTTQSPSPWAVTGRERQESPAAPEAVRPGTASPGASRGGVALLRPQSGLLAFGDRGGQTATVFLQQAAVVCHVCYGSHRERGQAVRHTLFP